MSNSPETSPLLPPRSVAATAVNGLHRRQVMRGGIALAAAGGVVMAAGHTSAVGTASLPAWSDPATWGSRGVPRPGEVVTVDFPVRLDQDITVGGLHVECDGHLVLDPAKSVTIRSTGTVEVCGVLEMRPSGPTVEHLLRFEGINESRFQGGGMSVMASDVGLWVHEDGQLQLHGAAKTAWARADGALRAGDRTLRLRVAPTGWRVGDELAVTPTGAPVDKQHHDRFDRVSITSISGSVVTLSSPLRFAHPQVEVGDGHVLTAEVLNLTRNVRVEGTPGGRTHTMVMMASHAQQVRYVQFRHFGPRKTTGKTSELVLGRYGIHFHMCQDGSRGSVLEGVVMRDGGNHAFVPHLSHGITHRACISFDTAESAYWWDRADSPSSPTHESDDIVYDACVAALVKAIPEYRGYSMAGFALGPGKGSAARDCVAVGVLGTQGASGFHWPGGSTAGEWEFTNCVSHNNRVHGIHTWQNTAGDHVVQRYIGYHNGGAGINHGAYRNGYVYRDSILYGNAGGGVVMHAVSKRDRQLTLRNLLIDNAGQGAAGIAFVGHLQAPLGVTRVEGCRLQGYTGYGIAFTGERPSERDETTADWVDIVDCQFSGVKFWISNTVHPKSRIRVLDGTQTFLLTPRRAAQRRGRVRQRWNARSRRIGSFTANTPAQPIKVGLVSSPRL